MAVIREFHLFAGIGGGIYGGKLLNHRCCGGVEIDSYCQKVLHQRQNDGWLEPFDIYGDILNISGKEFKNTFDVLCGGFPCQAFSTAAHGKNIFEKNIWSEMFRFAQESDAPVVFGENVASRAILKAKEDLESIGYTVKCCKLSCSQLGANHQRNRYWLLAVKNQKVFATITEHLATLPKLKADIWIGEPQQYLRNDGNNVRKQLRAVGNAQSPYVAASAFRILANRFTNSIDGGMQVTKKEIDDVFVLQDSWINKQYGSDFGLVHTPTTMANYSAPSMMKHQGCRNFVEVFGKPTPLNAEYLMGIPIGASSAESQKKTNLENWYGK